MRKRTFIVAIVLSFSITIISCRHRENKSREQQQNILEMPRAEKIKISDLTSVLTRLQNRQMEFDFFGIHSNGIDCIYFVPDNNHYSIEFEAMYEEQLPWIDKLKQFAKQNGYKELMTTYGNVPHYKSSQSAPVLRIETKSNLDQTAIIGQTIMTDVFGNNINTIYEVVP